jgi:hypothetical protein
MEVMLWFEDSGESTSTLPFLTNSKVGMAGFVNLHKMAPIKNSFSHFHNAQNGGKSAYFHLVQELHIAMHYLYNHYIHGRSKKRKPPISCAHGHSLCVIEVKKTYKIKNKKNPKLKKIPFPLIRYTSLFHIEFVVLRNYMHARKTNYREKHRKLGLQISL